MIVLNLTKYPAELIVCDRLYSIVIYLFIYLQRTVKGSVFNRLKFMLVKLANRTFS